MNICTLEQALALGLPECSTKLGKVTGFIISKKKNAVTIPPDINQINALFESDNYAFLSGMEERAAANEAATTHTFGYGRTVQLRGAIIQDNFIFNNDMCEQKNALSLVGFKGYAFAVTDTGQFIGKRVKNYNTMLLPFTFEVTTLDTTGIFSLGGSAVDTDTITVRYGEISEFVNDLTSIDVDWRADDILNPIKLTLTGNASALNVYQDCNMIPIDNILISDVNLSVTVNGNSATATISSVNGNVITYSLGTTPATGDTVSVSLVWGNLATIYGKSDKYTFIVA
jgi:hypothetical protein